MRLICAWALLLLLGGCQGRPPSPEGTGSTADASSTATVVPALIQSKNKALTPQVKGERGYAPSRVTLANYQIVKLNYAQASDLLKNEVGPQAAVARARLALYLADCEEARAHLSSSVVRNEKSAQDLIGLAESCFGATAGGVVIEDKEAGVWMRVQDYSDRVLAPLIFEVAKKARATLELDLGEQLPRPLRIDLVRDLFSLSAVSGLPVDAAETTGTVAVARWGRVTMVSPRAISSGFPWADTLAHEITHLLISRATVDRAPLWLQEGIAKRQERRWREAQLFDDDIDHSERAYEAQIAGHSIGVDQIGPSIAMLPSADDASTAFSEVTSFMEFWIARNGPRALNLLLRDIEATEDADAAMRSVSGYNVADWQVLWRRDLEKRFESRDTDESEDVDAGPGPRSLIRAQRLVELLTLDGFPQVAEFQGAVELDRAPHAAALRFLTARAAMLHEQGDDSLYLGEPDDLKQANAGWLAFYAAEQAQSASDAVVDELFRQARSLDPLLPEVACGGVPWVGQTATLDSLSISPLKIDEPLCVAARKIPIRGSR